jgi:hypothetical protein
MRDRNSWHCLSAFSPCSWSLHAIGCSSCGLSVGLVCGVWTSLFVPNTVPFRVVGSSDCTEQNGLQRLKDVFSAMGLRMRISGQAP